RKPTARTPTMTETTAEPLAPYTMRDMQYAVRPVVWPTYATSAPTVAVMTVPTRRTSIAVQNGNPAASNPATRTGVVVTTHPQKTVILENRPRRLSAGTGSSA